MSDITKVPEAVLPVCVVGAGPAGLAMARALKNAGLAFEVFEKNPGVGGIWDGDFPGSPMYDSAHFISSRDAPMSSFRGHPLPRTAAVYPSRSDVLTYLRGFAEAEDLPPHIRLSTAVEKARPGEGYWEVTAGGTTRRYSALICASGTLWDPVIPELAGAGQFGGRVRHSVTYRAADELRGKRVLIVGAGNSAVDIACDAARTARSVSLSMRRGYWFVPKFVAGEPFDTFIRRPDAFPQWASPPDAAALLRLLVGPPEAYGLPTPDHAPFASHPIMNSEVLHHIGHGRITPRGEVSRLDADGAVYADGAAEAVDEIILATGYRAETPYLPEGLFDYGAGLRPRLWMRLFHPSRRDVYGLGFLETNSSVFRLVDLGAEIIARHILAGRTGAPARMALDELADAGAGPDLSGGAHRIETARHVDYVDSRSYFQALEGILATHFPETRTGDSEDTGPEPK